MSTERPDNDVTTTRRRSPLVAASVAAAVLLAGGGGAYWAATAADGGDDTRSTASGGGSTPPPLALDDAGTPTAPSREGIAPGEPDPHGGRLVYRASGKLPDAPEKAAVQRAGARSRPPRSPGWRRRSASPAPRSPRPPPGRSAPTGTARVRCCG